jgi:hypothetical protein
MSQNSIFMEKNKIFISYRQSDTQSEASRLKENLEDIFGPENVFFDIETLEPGLNFAEAIEKTIRQSAVVLVLIGDSWTKVKDDKGNLRLFKEDDWVRKEVAMALSMDGTRVIPVLIKDAKKLSADELPDNIKSLANYQWAELTIPRWKGDVEKLATTLEKILPPLKKEAEKKKVFIPSPPPTKSWWAKNYLWVLGVFVLIIIISSWPKENVVNDYVEPETGQNIVAGGEFETSGAIDVHGNWIVYFNGEVISTFIISQYPDGIEFYEYDVNNSNVGTGTGFLEGNQLTLDYYHPEEDVPGKFYLSTQNGGVSWEGRASFPTVEVDANISLKKSNP